MADPTLTDVPGTRERLLEAAIEVIEAEGEVGVRVDRVAEMANITKPSLYHFFGDREGLIIAAQAERFRRNLLFGLDEFREATRLCTTSEEFLDLVSSVIREFVREEGMIRRAFRIEVLGSAVSRPMLREKIRIAMWEHTQLLGGIVRQAQEQGLVSKKFQANMIASWWAGLMLSRHTIEIDPDRYDAAEWDEITIAASRFILD